MRASVLFLVIVISVTVILPTASYFFWGKKPGTSCMRDYIVSNSKSETIWELKDSRIHIGGDYSGIFKEVGWSNGLLMSISSRPIASLYNTNYSIVVYILVKLGF